MAKKLSTTPVGIAVYPRLTGEADTKFDAAGVYSTKVRFEGEDAQKLVALIDAAMAESVAQAKKDNPTHKQLKVADSPAQEQEDGSVIINFKMAASGISKKTQKPWARKPRIFDAKGTPITTDPRIGGGTKLKVSYELGQWYKKLTGAGVSLRLEAVQILELVEFGGGNAESYGFGQEDGFEVNDTSEAEEDGFKDETAAAAAPAAPVSGKKADF